MKITIRINDLIEAHKDGYGKCTGCKMCDEIATLRKALEDGYRNVTLIKKGDEEMKLTKDLLEKHLREGLKVKEIAGMYDMGISTVHRFKSEWGLTKKQVSSTEKLEAVKQEVKQVIAGDPSKIQDLENLIAKLEGELSERKINEVFTNNNIAVLQTENNELKQQLDKLKEENTNLKASAEDTESEAYRAALSIKELTTQNAELAEEVEMLRENIKVAEEDRDLASWQYKELNKVYLELVRKNSLATKLLKEVL